MDTATRSCHEDLQLFSCGQSMFLSHILQCLQSSNYPPRRATFLEDLYSLWSLEDWSNICKLISPSSLLMVPVGCLSTQENCLLLTGSAVRAQESSRILHFVCPQLCLRSN